MKTDTKKKTETVQDSFRKSDKTLQAIYESTRSIRFIIFPDYTVLFFNKMARNKFFSLFGIEIVIGMNIFNYLENKFFPQNFDFHFQKSLNGEYVDTENLVEEENNKEWYKIDFHPLILDEKTIAVSISIRNINDKKKKEIKIQEQNALLRDTAFTISHHVRAPVANILGLMSLMDKSDLSKKNREICEYLETATKNLDKIITKVVIDIDKIEISK
jgi:signal transduction histidine kinase